MAKSAVTIGDVAQAAGVSKMSVSLAFRDNNRVSAATRERILRIAKELHYVPNQIARGLRSGKTNTIGFIVNDITNPFYAQVLKSIEQKFGDQGMEVIVGCSDWSAERETRLAEKMIRMRAMGVFIVPCERGSESLELFRGARIPFVVLDTVESNFVGTCVINDLQQCGRLAAEHFLEIGVKTPGFAGAPDDMAMYSAFQKIQYGYVETFAQAGIKIQSRNCVSGGLHIRDGINAWRQLAKQKSDADGIFCVNDLCAIGIMDEAESSGKVVGRDFALIGVDNLEISGLTRIGLTSIRQPFDEIAVQGALEIERLIDQPQGCNRVIVLPQKLVVRESTINFKK